MTGGVVIAISDWSIGLAVKFQFGSSKMPARCLYVARLAYWTVRHRSIEMARWIVAFEGYKW